MNIARRVYLGMSLLDKDRPGWEHKVNLNTLQMQDKRHCILGQLYGQTKWRISNLADFGFSAYVTNYEEMSLELWYLATEWKRQIKLRLEK